jgi:hypothetical protein
MLSNIREIRRKQAKYGGEKAGATKHVHIPRKTKEQRLKDDPVVIGDGDVVTNTWSSQTAFQKAQSAGMEAEGANEEVAAHMQAPATEAHTFTLEKDEPTFTPGQFLTVYGKSALLSGGRSQMLGNIWHAAFHGNVPTVEYLINVRCLPPDVRNRWGQTVRAAVFACSGTATSL